MDCTAVATAPHRTGSPAATAGAQGRTTRARAIRSRRRAAATAPAREARMASIARSIAARRRFAETGTAIPMRISATVRWIAGRLTPARSWALPVTTVSTTTATARRTATTGIATAIPPVRACPKVRRALRTTNAAPIGVTGEPASSGWLAGHYSENLGQRPSPRGAAFFSSRSSSCGRRVPALVPPFPPLWLRRPVTRSSLPPAAFSSRRL